MNNILLSIVQMPKRGVNFLKKLYYRHIFGEFHWSSSIICPLHIAGSKGIYIGSNVRIQKLSWIQSSPLTGFLCSELRIGDNTTIGHFNHIIATKSVIIGRNVLTADKVYISDNIHGYEDVSEPIKRQKIVQKNEVVIGDESWLGENVCVIGARIGKHCVIGANSVVTKDIPDYCIAVGQPARIIKRYDFKTNEWRKTDKEGNYII